MCEFRIKVFSIVVFMFSPAVSLHARPQAPFKVLFSNDFTNTINCTNPYHGGVHSPWTVDALEGSVKETSGIGVDVHMLQPAHTWVPWWKSSIYPMQEHYRWWKSR